MTTVDPELDTDEPDAKGWRPDHLLVPAVLAGSPVTMADLAPADRAWAVAGLMRAGHTADRAADEADGAPGPAGEVPCFDRLRMTLRTDAVHDSLTGRTTTTARLVTPDLDGDHPGEENQGVSEQEFKG